MPRPKGHIDLVWSDAELAEMRTMVESGGASISEIGRRFGCCDHTIRKRAKRFGWNLPTSWLRTSIKDRLLAKSYRAENGCRIWIGPKNHRGYGLLSYERKLQPAHRVAWKVHKGPIPEGLHVLHHCDTPACIEPECLFLGTHQDNVDDKMRKGRAKGNRGGGHRKLTDEQVEAIRADPRSPWYLSPIYGISYEHIRKIKKGEARKRPLAIDSGQSLPSQSE